MLKSLNYLLLKIHILALLKAIENICTSMECSLNASYFEIEVRTLVITFEVEFATIPVNIMRFALLHAEFPL